MNEFGKLKSKKLNQSTSKEREIELEEKENMFSDLNILG